MQNNKREIQAQIDAVNKLTGLNASVIEKDLFVTKAISIVSQIAHPHYDIVFQGGTSLAKAHCIIERMSEDCDFRIRFKDPEAALSKAFKRKALRAFRHDLVAALKAHGFSIESDAVRVRNEGQFMAIRANYPSVYPLQETLKPYLAQEKPGYRPVVKNLNEITEGVMPSLEAHLNIA